MTECSAATAVTCVTEDGPGRQGSLLARLASTSRSLLARRSPAPEASRSDLVTALNEITAVVSSKLSVQGVLQTVVDETKAVLGCGKVMLCLFAEEDPSAEAESVVVRGSVDEYPQSWWEPEVRAMARGLEPGHTIVREDRGQAACLACVPITLQQTVVGVLAAVNPNDRSFGADEMTLLGVLGAFAGASIENARLVSEAQYSLLASERNRIAKEMHDGLAQSLFSAALALEVCKKRVATDPEGVAEELARTQRELSDSVGELRRYIYDLRPASLDRLGLVGAIESAVDEAAADGRLRARLRLEGGERRLPPASESCLYRIAQESIANAAKHARATSVQVQLKFEEDSAELAVIDDGCGFDVEAAVGRADRGTSIGLRSIRDRVKAQGGRLRISSVPGEGTHLWVRIPC